MSGVSTSFYRDGRASDTEPKKNAEVLQVRRVFKLKGKQIEM